MGFEPWNRSLKIWDSIRTPTPKVGAHLKVWGFIPSHSPTFPGAWIVIPGLHSWPAPLQALALVVSLRLRLWNYYNLPTHLTTTYLCTYPPIYLRTYYNLLTYPPTYELLPTYLPIYPPTHILINYVFTTYLTTHLPTCVPHRLVVMCQNKHVK
jgi:hypothetical protein